MSDDAFRPPVVRPPDRYGDRPKPAWRRRVQRIVIATLLAAALGWWIQVALTHSTPAVTYDLIGFDHVTDTSVEVRFRVDRDSGAAVSCVLRARDLAGAEVGRVRVTIPTDSPAPVEVTETVRTTDRAVSAEVVICAQTED